MTSRRKGTHLFKVDPGGEQQHSSRSWERVREREALLLIQHFQSNDVQFMFLRYSLCFLGTVSSEPAQLSKSKRKTQFNPVS
jgi:hypothetical protein